MWSYEIDEERRLVITTAWDVVTSDEILEHRRQLKSDARFRRTFFQLLDLTRVTGIALDYRTSLVLARENLFSRESQRAFVAPSPLAFGMSRMFITLRQFYREAEQMKVFKDRDEAVQWLFPRLDSQSRARIGD